MLTLSRQNPIGIQAIDSALQTRYPDMNPIIHAPMSPLAAGGDEPIEMVAVYEREYPVAHWHFITYGFSDLYEKKIKNTPVSGFGFELSFRLVKTIGENEPPEWVFTLLQDLAKTVFSSGSRFDNGFFLATNKKIRFQGSENLSTMLFAYDPELKPINTANGILVFLQVIGITEDEKLALISWNSSKFLSVMAENNSVLVTDIYRSSILTNPLIQEKIAQGIAKDGSSTETLQLATLNWREFKKRLGKKTYQIEIPNKNFSELCELMKNRLGKGRELTLLGPKQRVAFSLRDQSSVYVNDFELKIYFDIRFVKEVIERLDSRKEEQELSCGKFLQFYFTEV